MTKTFYTNVQVYGNNILYRGVKNGQRISKKVSYQPTLFVKSNKPTQFTTIFGEYLAEMKPGTIKDCRDFIERYKEVKNFPIYGQTRFEYNFIAELFPQETLDWDINDIVIANIDIEVGSDNGFPSPDEAIEAITAITVVLQGKYYVFGCGDFTTNDSKVEYRKCRDEIDLINQFLAVWTLYSPDMITGWNIKGFDIPYLVNRIVRLLGEDVARKLSPWGVIRDKMADGRYGKQYKTYSIFGCSVIDYLELYIKYAPDGKSQERYTLDHIGHTELNERKLSYEEHGSLHTLYKKDFQKYIEYNIQDTRLVERLNEKLRLIELVLTLAYDGKFNYEDCFMQVRMWDVILYNELFRDNIIIPPVSNNSKSSMYAGAYVKEPVPGMYGWVCGFDLTSLYPSLIMQYNISPETLLQPQDYPDDLRDFIANNTINVENLLNEKLDLSILKKYNLTMTPNGQFFKRDDIGFMPKITKKMFADRQKYKNEMKKHKKDLEKLHKSKVKNRIEEIRLEALISRFDNLQLAKKVCLNSLYGASGSQFFRFFDLRIALAITTSGQLSIQWAQNRVNNFMNKLMETTAIDYVIASDTDSMYMNLGPLVKKVFANFKKTYTPRRIIKYMDRVSKYKLQPFIDKVYGELSSYVNAFENTMNMKREALSDKAIWTAKKRYIMNVYDNEGVEYATPEIKVMGLEVRKSSTPGAVREKLTEAIEIIINGTNDDLIKFIDDVRKDFKMLPVEDIAFPRGVNNLSQYSSATNVYNKGTPMHVRASLLYNHLVKENHLEKELPIIREGEKIKFVYLREPNPIRENVIAFPLTLSKKLDLHDYIDYNTQFEKSFLDPLKAILDVMGWSTKKIRTLKEFRK
jgi:DNA polymerase elongation subunit (family B)